MRYLITKILIILFIFFSTSYSWAAKEYDVKNSLITVPKYDNQMSRYHVLLDDISESAIFKNFDAFLKNVVLVDSASHEVQDDAYLKLEYIALNNTGDRVVFFNKKKYTLDNPVLPSGLKILDVTKGGVVVGLGNGKNINLRVGQCIEINSMSLKKRCALKTTSIQDKQVTVSNVAEVAS